MVSITSYGVYPFPSLYIIFARHSGTCIIRGNSTSFIVLLHVHTLFFNVGSAATSVTSVAISVEIVFLTNSHVLFPCNITAVNVFPTSVASPVNAIYFPRHPSVQHCEMLCSRLIVRPDLFGRKIINTFISVCCAISSLLTLAPSCHLISSSTVVVVTFIALSMAVTTAEYVLLCTDLGIPPCIID